MLRRHRFENARRIFCSMINTLDASCNLGIWGNLHFQKKSWKIWFFPNKILSDSERYHEKSQNQRRNIKKYPQIRIITNGQVLIVPLTFIIWPLLKNVFNLSYSKGELKFTKIRKECWSCASNNYTMILNLFVYIFEGKLCKLWLFQWNFGACFSGTL